MCVFSKNVGKTNKKSELLVQLGQNKITLLYIKS